MAGDGSPFANFACDFCGACCQHLLVEAGWLDAQREPRLYEIAPKATYAGLRSGEQVVMLYDSTRRCCLFLTEAIGARYCAIYATRPAECVAVEAGDAIILLDGEQWPDWSDAQRRALIDHELTHLIVADTGDDDKDTDDYGRPKLSIRPHDREFGWFDEVAKRHGDASFEHSQLAAFRKSCIDPGGSQLWLPFADDAATVSPETDPDIGLADALVKRMTRRRAASNS